MFTDKNIIIIGLIVSVLFSCKSEKADLSNSKWVYNFEQCNDYLEFVDESKYNFYSCELDEKFYGSYLIKLDTLFLESNGSEYDSDFKKDSKHKAPKEKFTLLIENDIIKWIDKWEFKNNDWNKSDYIFDKDYIFKKIR